MVNFRPPAAEISLPVWGTPANFNGFCVLAVLGLLHGSQVFSGRQPNFAALKRALPMTGRAAISLGIGPHSSSIFSSPNLSRRRLDVCHTSTHGVALVRI